MSFVVKNTTKYKLFDLICPHSCRGCGRLGAVCCECCKNNMIEKREIICPICKEKLAKTAEKGDNMPNRMAWRHEECEMPFAGLWAFGWRDGVLEKLVEEYKYQSVRAMGEVLMELYDMILPKELEEAVVVPLPTIGRHVRERGLDHTLTLAKGLAKRRGWKCERILARAVDTVQVGVKAAEREIQASKAYEVAGEVDAEKTYLLIDDVWTTGATMLSAAKVLQAAGAQKMCGVVLAVSRPKTERAG